MRQDVNSLREDIFAAPGQFVCLESDLFPDFQFRASAERLLQYRVNQHFFAAFAERDVKRPQPPQFFMKKCRWFDRAERNLPRREARHMQKLIGFG